MTADAAIAARPKTTLVSLLLVSFLCGAAAGAVGMRSYAFRAAHHHIALEEVKSNTLERWKKQLNLSDDQTAQLSSILDDFDKYYDNVLAEGHERIMQVLNSEQRRKFHEMLKEQN